jgi:tRNA A-37 threonylcarbamoyl transferase component Bud32
MSEERKGTIGGEPTLPAFGAQTDVSIGGLDDDYPTGTILGDRYRIVRVLGHGTTTAVYLADHVAIGRQIAVKILKRTVSRAPEVIERFRREARVVTGIGHPNIAEVFDFGETRLGDKYVVMEYLGGRSLYQEIERSRGFELERSLSIAMQICRALHAAHKVGIVHRDLRPANVMLIEGEGYRDFVKVMDFGMARLADRTDRTYLAPEQLGTTAIDRRADVYALGCMLREMLSHPSQPLAEVVRHATAEDPDHRFESMAELEAALLAAAQHSGVRPHALPARPGMIAMEVRPGFSAPAAPAQPSVMKLAVLTAVLAALVSGVGLGRLASRRGGNEGMLVVDSQPPGAHALVDGRDVGPTPAIARNLGEGSHQVEVSLDGYTKVERRVDVRAHDVAELRLPLAHRLYRVHVQSTPPGAHLTADGVAVGETPAEASLSEREFHELRIDKAGFEVWRRAIKADERPAQLQAELTPTPAEFGSLFVESDVTARVFIDGRDTGFTTPTAEIRLPPGRHMIACRDGEEVTKLPVTIKAGDTTRRACAR